MRNLLGLLLVAALGAMTVHAGSAPAAPTAKPSKTTICHFNRSAAKPYTKLRLTKAQTKGHQRHAADIIPLRAAACPTTELSPDSGGRAFTATLNGSAVLPGPGDPDGSGAATIRLRLGEGRICYELSVAQITLPATIAQITLDPEGPAGTVTVKLAAPGTEGSASGCAAAPRALVAAILAKPSDYFITVQTSDFPNGAVRGRF
jgi:CHRD domain